MGCSLSNRNKMDLYQPLAFFRHLFRCTGVSKRKTRGHGACSDALTNVIGPDAICSIIYVSNNIMTN